MTPTVTSATVETVAMRSPAMNVGQRQRQLDLHEHPRRAVAHAARGLADVVGHALQPGEEVAHQDDQRVRTSPISTVVADSPVNGKRNANIASDGIV
jgi:hypothetical protein